MPYYHMNIETKEVITFATDDYQLITDNVFGNEYIIFEFQERDDNGFFKSFHAGKILKEKWDKILSNPNAKHDPDSYVIEIMLGVINYKPGVKSAELSKPVQLCKDDLHVLFGALHRSTFADIKYIRDMQTADDDDFEDADFEIDNTIDHLKSIHSLLIQFGSDGIDFGIFEMCNAIDIYNMLGIGHVCSCGKLANPLYTGGLGVKRCEDCHKKMLADWRAEDEE